MWKPFFKWKCLSKEKGKNMDGEIFVLYIRGCTDKYKEKFIL